ncbi:MAG: polysaccharide biosynthesis tyrosine autokinase [Planctomycetaceae bacterium]
MYGSNAAPAEEDQDAELDVVGFLKRRKLFILVLGLLGAGIGYMLFQRQIPVYRSAALVQVIHRSVDTRMNIMTGSDRDLKDAAFEITSPSLIKPAYEKHNLGELALLKDVPVSAAVDRIASMTSAKIGLNSKNVLEIAVDGANAEEISLIANAIAEEYVNTQIENYKDASSEIHDILIKRRDDLHEELKSKEKEYNTFRQNCGLLSDGKNPHRERQQSYLTQLAALSLEKTSLQAELSTLEEALRSGGSREGILMAIGQLTNNIPQALKSDDGAVWGRTTEEQMIPLLLEQVELQEKLGKDHPKVKAIERRITFTRQFLEKFAVAEKETGTSVSPDFIAAYLQSLRQQLQTISKEREELDVQAKQAEILARALGDDENEDRTRRNEIDRLMKLFDSASSHASETRVTADMGGVRAQILTPARYGRLVFPKLSQFLGLGGFLGGFLGLALGYLVEIADRSFRKPEDVIREFGVPIIGHIPFMKEERLKGAKVNNGMDRTAVCVHQPRSRPAEAYRSVRTAICFSALGSSHRVIQVSSPAAGDGKSTLALNLSIALAMSGKRTILVESDFRRPKVHKLTAVENKYGIVDVLRGNAELADAVQSTSVESFFVLPCGSRPKDPAELLSRPEYERLLEVLREKYDYVIVDTPPILAVTDPTSIAPRVDGVLLAMRLGRNTRDLGRRTLDQLRDVGATVSGIVINGVEESDGYGYGSQYYYKSYDYGYGHEGKAKEDYFSEERSESTDADIVL